MWGGEGELGLQCHLSLCGILVLATLRSRVSAGQLLSRCGPGGSGEASLFIFRHFSHRRVMAAFSEFIKWHHWHSLFSKSSPPIQKSPVQMANQFYASKLAFGGYSCSYQEVLLFLPVLGRLCFSEGFIAQFQQ